MSGSPDAANPASSWSVATGTSTSPAGRHDRGRRSAEGRLLESPLQIESTSPFGAAQQTQSAITPRWSFPSHSDHSQPLRARPSSDLARPEPTLSPAGAPLSPRWAPHITPPRSDDVFSEFSLNLLSPDDGFFSTWPALPVHRSHQLRPASPALRPDSSNGLADPHSFSPSTMARQQPLPRGRKRSFVDIDDVDSSDRLAKRIKHASNEPSGSSSHQAPLGTLSSSSGNQGPKTVEEIDLVDDDVDALAATLRKQRAEQVMAQQQAPSSTAKSKLTSLICTVCLDTPKDLTATACGHTFCHSCLMDWLVAAEKSDSKRTNCPACRHRVSRSKKGPTDVIPLEIMKRSALINGGRS